MDTHGSNEKFLEDMSYLTLKANCKLIICPRVENRNDRWIQVGAEADSRRELGAAREACSLAGGKGSLTGA